MIIRNFTIRDDGSASFETEMTSEENATLIEYAIVSLINTGHITVDEEMTGDLFETDNKELH